MPDGTIQSLLILLMLFQAKHFICDGPLQTSAMVRDKGYYGRWLGLRHAATHGAGTLVVFLIGSIAPAWALGLAFVDFAIHYHVDFSKEQIVRRAGWTTANPQFWWSLSADQMLHQLTYIALSAVALRVW